MVLTADRLGLAASQVSPGRLSGGQGGDLGPVVGEGSVSDPDSGSFGAVEPAAVPALATYQGADPALAFGSPFDGSSDPPAVFDGMLGFGWFAFAGMTCCGRRGRARHPPRPARRSHGP